MQVISCGKQTKAFLKKKQQKNSYWDSWISAGLESLLLQPGSFKLRHPLRGLLRRSRVRRHLFLFPLQYGRQSWWSDGQMGDTWRHRILFYYCTWKGLEKRERGGEKSLLMWCYVTDEGLGSQTSLRCFRAVFSHSCRLLWLPFNDCSTICSSHFNLKRLLWEFYVLIKGSEAQRCNFHKLFHKIGVFLHTVTEIKDCTKHLD